MSVIEAQCASILVPHDHLHINQGRASPGVRIREMQGDIGVPVRRAYGHRPTGLTWAMAWVGTAMMPLAVRTLMAPAGPLTSGPHQA